MQGGRPFSGGSRGPPAAASGGVEVLPSHQKPSGGVPTTAQSTILSTSTAPATTAKRAAAASAQEAGVTAPRTPTAAMTSAARVPPAAHSTSRLRTGGAPPGGGTPMRGTDGVEGEGMQEGEQGLLGSMAAAAKDTAASAVQSVRSAVASMTDSGTGQKEEEEMLSASSSLAASDRTHHSWVAGGSEGVRRGRIGEGDQEEPGLLAKAAQATSQAATAAMEATKDAVAAVTGTDEPTVLDDEETPAAPTPSTITHGKALRQTPAASMAATTSTPSVTSPAAPGLSPSPSAKAASGGGLSSVLEAKRQALHTGAPIPPATKAPSARAAAQQRAAPVGYVPLPGALPSRPVHAVGGGREVSAQHATEEEVATSDGPRTGARTSGMGGGRHKGMDENWVSELTEKLWPYVRVTAENMAWEMLPPLLEANEPSWIHDLSLKKFKLGEKVPNIKNIVVYEDDNDIMDDAFIEFEFEWHSKQDIEIEIQVLPDDVSTWIPDIIDRTLSKLLTLVVGVEDVKVDARIRVALRPLLRRLPVVGAVQVALVNQPTFDYTPTLGQGAAPLLPAIKGWLDNTIRDMALQPYVLPDHYFYPLDPEAEDLDKPTGVLMVKVLEARKVPKMDFLSRSDAFVELFVRSSQRHRTGVISTKNPRWQESFEMPVHVPEHQALKLVLWDYDPASPNDEIGRSEIKLSELTPGDTKDLWLDVRSHSEEEQDRMKHDMSKTDRAVRGVAKPLVHHSTRGCQMHVQVTFVKFSDEEEKLIARGARQGMEQLLASPEGRGIDPRLHNVLLSGKLSVRVPHVQGIKSSSLFGRPSMKFATKIVGGGKGKEKESTPAKLSKRGALDFQQELQLDVKGEERRNAQSAVVIELREAGWFGGGCLGRLAFNLREVIQRRQLRGSYRLGKGRGQMNVEVTWHSYF